MEAINWHTFFFYLFALVTCGFALAVVLAQNIVRMAFSLIVSLGASAGLFFLAGAGFVGAMQLMIYVGGTLVLLVFGVMLTAQGPFVSMRTRGGEWVLAAVVGGSLLAVLLQVAFRNPAWLPGAEQQRPLARVHTSRLDAQFILEARRADPKLLGTEVVIQAAGQQEAAPTAVYDPAAGRVVITIVPDKTTAAEVVQVINQPGSPLAQHFRARLPQGHLGLGALRPGDGGTVGLEAPRSQERPARLGLALLGARVDDPKRSGYLLPFEIVSVHLLVVLVGAAYLARARRRAATEAQREQAEQAREAEVLSARTSR